ncbi:MAG: PLP-dependent aminotransferase family protein [Erysipelotrichaceae bacterium]|nr:PLP-dependent aminotransferase family protein [Erysipelotrichaceae bacterium]
MLTYTIPDDLKMPIYEYIYQCIKKDIIKGKLKAHDKLPSKRALAANLNVSVITVENAYGQLIIEGYLSAIEKKGYFVNSLQIPFSIESELSLERSEEDRTIGLDLQRNAVSASSFPIDTWSRISRKILLEKREEIFISADKKGYLPLRKAIAQHLREFSSIDAIPDQIIIGAGSEYLYNLLALLLGKERIYALEDPGHQGIERVYALNDVKHVHIKLDKEGISMKDLLESKATVAHISCAHHFPTGITTSAARRYELLKWAMANDGYIIEDDYDNEFRLKGKPIAPLYSIDNSQRVIYMNTFSKTISPTFRISYLVLPKKLKELYRQKMGFLSCPVSTFDQMILAEFIESKYFERHLNRMRNHYKGLRDALVNELKKQEYYSHIRIRESDSGLHFLLEYDYAVSDQEIAKQALKLGMKIAPLSYYYHGECVTHTLVINYSGLDIDKVKEVAKKLEMIFKEKAS